MENYCLDYFNRKNAFRRAKPVMKPAELFAQYLNNSFEPYIDIICKI